MDDLLPEFLAETNEALAELDLALVKLELEPGDQATLSLIFRMVHTIKGTCGFLGLPRLEHVAHAAENVLGRVRDGELAATPGIVSLVLSALDQIKLIVAALADAGAEPEGDDAAIIAALNRAADGSPPASAGAVSTPEIDFDAIDATPPAVPVHTPPGTAAATPPIPAAQPAKPATDPQVTASADAAAGQTIRVAVDVLEELMTLVGELVLTRNQLMQLSRAEAAAGLVRTQASRVPAAKAAVAPDVSAYTAPLQRLSHITSDLQDKVMKTRMQPIGTAWNKLPRLVRDLAQETGKTIVLEMRGQETELDRQVLDLMRDPLTHMVRNSADHGLEPTADRRAAGKPDAGRILLRAYHEGGHIIIEISDDGRGINVARVREKALSKGLATEAELAGMTDAQIRSFIFRAGFSTAEAVTAISGRGVGMDVVRSNIERIGGTIELASTEGAGSCFTVKIPLTLAIISAVIVQSGAERFAIPQIAVRELVHLAAAMPDTSHRRPTGPGAAAGPAPGPAPAAAVRIERVAGAQVLRLRDELLPLIDLTSLLRLEPPSEPPCLAPQAGTTIVVTAVGSVKMGIVVDEVFDTEEIVVKPVAPVLRHVTMFSGNTILGDGSVIMILDPNGVARSAGIAARAVRHQPEDAAAPSGSDEHVALLLFRAGGARNLFAVPLSLVARLETIDAARIEQASSSYVTQYRGQLMTLIAMQDATRVEPAPPQPPQPTQPVLVFADRARSMGLMVDSIVDVVHGRLQIELGSTRPGVLGTAVIGGHAADVLDTGFWLTLAFRDWFATPTRPDARRPHVLVVEDSDFFRQLLTPTLAAAGYDISAARGGEEALTLRDGGLMVDAIVSDLEMPGMDGLHLARLLRSGGAWSALPMIALSAHDGQDDEARAAGFTAYVRKSERALLMDTLRGVLTGSAPAAALAATLAQS